MGNFKDLTGEKINNWIVREFKGLNKHQQSLWLVECDCLKHIQRIKTTSAIKSDKSCGCLNVENLKGIIFGKWEVISDPIIKSNNKTFFKCKCSCDKHTIKLVRADRLKNGTSTSCGCYALEVRTKHGLSRERIANIWYGMLDRCANTERDDYKNYGGRGIFVCEEWSNQNNYQGLINFVEWGLENGYDENLTIERIDVDGIYEPNNCTWVTMKEQAKNKRCTIYLDIDNESDKLVDLVKENNIKRGTLLRRYNSGIRDSNVLLSKNQLNNKSGVVGVSYSTSQDNWRAYININKERIELGRSKSKLKTIKSRLEAEINYFGIEEAPQRHLFELYDIENEGEIIKNEENY